MIVNFKLFESKDDVIGYYYIPYSDIDLIKLAIEKIHINKEMKEFLQQRIEYNFDARDYSNLSSIYLILRDTKVHIDLRKSWGFIPINTGEFRNLDYIKKEYYDVLEKLEFRGILELEPYEISAMKYNL